jgi:hypothetical protein
MEADVVDIEWCVVYDGSVLGELLFAKFGSKLMETCIIELVATRGGYHF